MFLAKKMTYRRNKNFEEKFFSYYRFHIAHILIQNICFLNKYKYFGIKTNKNN